MAPKGKNVRRLRHLVPQCKCMIIGCVSRHGWAAWGISASEKGRAERRFPVTGGAGSPWKGQFTMKLLVTGAAGFIGSNFVHHMLETYEDVEIVNIDVLTYAGNLENLADLGDSPRHVFVRGDITSREDLAAVFGDHAFDAVVNFAAESHVDRSLHEGPEAFIQTNILGTQRLLDASRQAKVARFMQVSTDEVYGSLGASGRFTEASPIQPNNPYAATKAWADFMVRAAARSFGLDAATTRCSNNFGPYQFPEKLIPLMIANAVEDKALPVYGDGLHVRDWIYVRDHCSAIDTVLRKAAPGSVYNVGGDYDVPNLEIVRAIRPPQEGATVFFHGSSH